VPRGGRPSVAELLGGDDKHAVMGEAVGDRRLVERYGGGTTVLSSARWRRWMIVDGRGGAEVRCRKSRQVHLRES
jgi:hypothetical protein